MGILVIDVGTSSVRAAVVDRANTILRDMVDQLRPLAPQGQGKGKAIKGVGRTNSC